MSPQDEALAEEIDRIVNSPYPTELRTLRELLVVKCTSGDISRWVLSKPCQLERLVECVLNGLRQWPYVLDIIAKLSHNGKARNAFLGREPTLLHDVIVQAIRHGIDSTYMATSVALLSHPLPEDVGLPSDVQTLFIQLIDHAAQQPSVTAVRSIYQILSRTSTSLLPILSSDVLLRFEDHLFGILRNHKGDDPSLCLYTLAIMRILATASNEQYAGFSTSSYDTQELLASTPPSSSVQWKPETVQQYFTERKGQKTMQLIVLRVMWACTPTTGESIDEKMESLALANEIIAAVPPSERETWRKANTLVPKKFEEKVFAPALEPALRFQALCFLARLGEGSIISTALMNGLRQITTSIDKIMEALHECNLQSIECLTSCGVFDANTTTAFLQNLVDFAASNASEEMVQQSGLLVDLLQKLVATMSKQDAISEGTMLALDVLSCGPKLHSLGRLIGRSQYDQIQTSRTSSCCVAVQRSRNELVHEICRLFLRAALSTSHQMYSISPDTLSLLLDLHASSAQSPPACSHVRHGSTLWNRPMYFVEAGSTPDDSVNWRDALRSELCARTTSEYERMESIFVKACGELESRCQNIEKPLEEEKQRSLALQEKHEELQQAYARLESEGIDRAVQFGVLEVERDQCQTDLELVQEDNTRLDLKRRELEQRVRDIENKAVQDVSEERRLRELTELEHSTVLAKKEEELDDMKERLDSLEANMQSREQHIERLQNEIHETEVKVQASGEELELLHRANGEQKDTIDCLTEERNATMIEKEEYKSRISRLEVEMNGKQEVHSLQVDQLKNGMNQALEAEANKHRMNLEQLATDHKSETTTLKRKLWEVEDAARLADEHHVSEIERRDNEISEYAEKLDRLGRKCEQKDRQIAEANAMRSNLMAAMGLGGQQAQFSLPHRSQSSTLQIAQKESEDQEEASPPTPLSGDDFETQELGARLSFASNLSSGESRSGPTPKRLRPRKSTRISSPSQPAVSISNVARTSRSATKRQPLSRISANPSTKKTSFSKPHQT